jgi:hypothetical protein
MRIRHLIAIVTIPALTLAACGDDDESTDESDTSAEVDEGTDVESTIDVDPDDLDAGEEAFDAVVPEQCEFLFDLSVAVGLAASGQVDPSDFSVDDAPDEVRDDVQVMVDAFVDYDPTNPSTAEVFASDEFSEASDNVAAFVEANCDADALG